MAGMSARVVARLSLQGQFTQRSFRLLDLAATLHAFAPQRIELCFHLGAQGESTLYLACAFDAADERAQLLRENLLRADFAGRFDCVFIEGADGVPAMRTVGIAVPDDAQLPSGQWIALPVSLLAAAVDVFRHAQANGLCVGYRVCLVPREAGPGSARPLVPALATLTTRRAQPELTEALRGAIEVISGDGWSAQEALMLPDGADVAWLEKLVLHRLRLDLPFFPSDFWEIRRDGPAPPSLAQQVQQARGLAYPEAVLEAIAPSHAEAAPLPIRRQPSAAGAGDYVFLSYAHADDEHAQKVRALLGESGVRVWYDRGIQPGAVWDQELENRIREAGAFVACLSAFYEQSRYCRRELKFADLLSKPILPIAPVAWSWGEGLQLMFQELQVCSFEQAQGFESLLQALRRAAPRVFE